MNAQQLKNAILQEAIEGRLVPQDPNDEPASVLLARIRKEKERLVKAGKLKKKDLEVKPISEDEIPFEIPESWEWVRLKDIINGTGAGKSPNCEKRPKSGNEWGVITTTAIQYCSFLPNENKVLPSKFVVNELQIVKDKDLLITRAGPKNRTGIVCVVDKPCDKLILSDKTVRIDYFRGYCNPFFLMYALNNPTIHDSIMSATVGMAESQVNISQSSIQNIVIPLPPLAEQHRIVTKIEVFLPKVEEYGKAQDALNKLNAELPERLKKSILQEAIEGRLVPQDPNDEPASVLLAKIRKEKEQLVKEGKLKKKELIETPISEEETPFDIPDSWEWVRFGTITFNRDSERVPLSVDERSKLKKIYDYYGASGVIDKVDKYLFDKPLLLIGEDGANLINRSTPIAFIAKGKFWVNNHAHVLDYINEDLMQYICWYINAISLVDYITGTAQPKMNQEKMNSILVALPPLAEQKRIVVRIEELLKVIDKL